MKRVLFDQGSEPDAEGILFGRTIDAVLARRGEKFQFVLFLVVLSIFHEPSE